MPKNDASMDVAAQAEADEEARLAAEVEAQAEADRVAAENASYTEAEKAAGDGLDLPALPDVTAPAIDADLRDQVADANADLEPGQTVITTVAGNAVVSGTPRPSSADTAVTATLNEPGDYLAVDTPAGRIVVGLEADSSGGVFVSARTEDRAGVEGDSILLRA